MLTLKQLRHLRAILKHGTIHAAADALHLTQSAITRSLNTLEESLGIRLFERAKTGMTPTDFCLKIASDCSQVLLDIDDIEREASLYRQVESGELNIAVGRAIKELALRDTLPEFMVTRPKISVSVSEGTPNELSYRLKQREIDLLLAGFGSYRSDEELVHQHLADVPLSIVVRKGHPLEAAVNVPLKQLGGYPLIASTLLTSSNPLLAALSNAAPILDRPILNCGDYATLKAVLLQTDAWLPVPAQQFSEELRNQQLVQLDVRNDTLMIELSIIELKGRVRSPAAQAFVELCQTHLSQLSKIPKH